MPSPIDRHFGIHAEALQLRARRGELLASNLANADTPNYKARDLDFKAALSRAQDGQSVSTATTHAKHIGAQQEQAGTRTLYRVPSAPSLDGNTVDAQVEQAQFAENAVRYRASLRFLSGKIQGLMTAIRGE
jgi:flagellar basal-body rod protein FlgB